MEHFISQFQQETLLIKGSTSEAANSRLESSDSSTPMVDIADITLGAIRNNEVETLQMIRRIKRIIRVA
jgi:hypothetical protein